jgi:IS30 family transposase
MLDYEDEEGWVNGPHGRYRRFTFDEKYQIRVGVERGESATAIAHRIGRTPQSVKRHGNAVLGLKFKPPWTEQDNQMLRELNRRNWTSRAIGEYMHRTRGAILAQASRIGVSFSRSGKA